MQKREGRSFAPPSSPPPRPEPGRTGRRGWQRPDVPRPDAAVRVPLPSSDAMVPEIEDPKEGDDILWLPQAARRDFLTAAWERGL